MKLPAVPRALLLATVLLTLLLAAGGFVLGRSSGDQGTPTAAPLRTTPVPEQRDPIVVPESLEIPRG